MPGSIGALEIAFARHGGFIAVRRGSIVETRDLLLARVDSPTALQPFLVSPAAEENPAFSPDGSLLAYASNESGRYEVYIRPVPGPGARLQISRDGGKEPVWSPDGKQIFFRGSGRFMAATLARVPELAVERRDSLFKDVFAADAGHASYDVFPDGRSLVMVQSEQGDIHMIGVVNWTEDLKRKTSKHWIR